MGGLQARFTPPLGSHRVRTPLAWAYVLDLPVGRGVPKGGAGVTGLLSAGHVHSLLRGPRLMPGLHTDPNAGVVRGAQRWCAGGTGRARGQLIL